jgi:hypothetical protein
VVQQLSFTHVRGFARNSKSPRKGEILDDSGSTLSVPRGGVNERCGKGVGPVCGSRARKVGQADVLCVGSVQCIHLLLNVVDGLPPSSTLALSLSLSLSFHGQVDR